MPTREDIVVTRMGARFLGRQFCCSIGRSGITNAKVEGDGATPAGVFQLIGIMFRPDRIKTTAIKGALPISLTDIWSDDPLDPGYNHPASAVGGYGFSHERLRRSDNLYDLVIPTDYNLPDAVPGKGSAIFLHVWRRPRYPTAGCVAFALDDLLWIARQLTGRTRLIIQAP